MGTRSYIQIKKSNGTNFVGYIAYDSYPEEILPIFDKIKNHSELDAIASISRICDSTWDNQDTKYLKRAFRRKWWEDYLYVFDMRTRKFYCYRIRLKESNINLTHYNEAYNKYLK